VKNLTLVLVIVGAALSACAPSPEQLALARQIDTSTQATATIAAINAKAQATIASGQAQATATSLMLGIQATQTAAPFNSVAVGVTTATNATKQWAMALLGVVGGLLVLLCAGSAAAAWLRSRAMQMPRDKSGQLPGVLEDGVVTDPQRMIGPSIALPRQPDFLWQIARAVRYLRTGLVEPVPDPSFTLTDGGADADHLLAAAQSANWTTGMASMFRPDNAERGRRDKIEILKRDAGKGLLGSGFGASSPQTRVIVQGDSAIQEIARQLGQRLPLSAQTVTNEKIYIPGDVSDNCTDVYGTPGASECPLPRD